MGELRFLSLESSVVPDVVTQEAEYETRTHPEGREDDDGNDISGQEYQEVVIPELRGAATFTVTGEAAGFAEGEKAQIDIALTGGYREFQLVDLPAGEEPQTVVVTFGPGPLHLASGQATVIAFLADADGNLLGDPEQNAEGTLSYPDIARLSR